MCCVVTSMPRLNPTPSPNRLWPLCAARSGFSVGTPDPFIKGKQCSMELLPSHSWPPSPFHGMMKSHHSCRKGGLRAQPLQLGLVRSSPEEALGRSLGRSIHCLKQTLWKVLFKKRKLYPLAKPWLRLKPQENGLACRTVQRNCWSAAAHSQPFSSATLAFFAPCRRTWVIYTSHPKHSSPSTFLESIIRNVELCTIYSGRVKWLRCCKLKFHTY